MTNHIEDSEGNKLPNTTFPPKYEYVNELNSGQLSDIYSKFHAGKLPPRNLYGSGVVGGIENLRRHIVSRMMESNSTQVTSNNTSEWGPLFKKGGFIGSGRRWRRR